MPTKKNELKFLGWCTKGDIEALHKVVANYSAGTYDKVLLAGLKAAAENYQTEAIKLLLRIPFVQANAAANGNAALKAAQTNSDARTVVLLLKNKAVRDHFAKMKLPSFDALCWVATSGETELMQHLLKYPKIRAMIAHEQNDVLRSAVSNGDSRMVKLLLSLPEVRSKAAINNNDILEYAMGHDDIKTMQLLLDIPEVAKSATQNDLILNYVKRSIQKRDWPKIFSLLKISIVLERVIKDDALLIKVIDDDEMLKALFEIPEIKAKAQNSALFKRLKAALIAHKHLHQISQTIVIQTPFAKGAQQPPSLPKISRVISNNEGYKFTAEASGNPVSNGRNPIGYNIHLPEGPIRNVLVRVYGGNPVGSPTTEPGELNPYEIHCLNNGTAVVTLNLPDLLHLAEYQLHMDEPLFIEIQSAIHTFFMILKEHPENLHRDLKNLGLNNKKIFLYGGSFGGLMAIRHAALFPNTFDGYIAHDALLSAEMASQSDLIERGPALSHLDPAAPDAVATIADPLLLMHNQDDQNVNIKNVFAFFEALAAQNKSHLANLGIMPIGNPMIEGILTSKGHNTPTTKAVFELYANTVDKFMENGLSSVPELTAWRAYKHGLLANKHFMRATLVERFIAEVLERARFDEKLARQLKDIDSAWPIHLYPLFEALYFVDTLAQDPNDLRLELTWLVVSDEMIKKWLITKADTFLVYLNEMVGIEFKQTDLTSKELIDVIRLHIQSLPNNPQMVHFLLDSLYYENPQLLQRFRKQFKDHPTFQEVVDRAKATLQVNVEFAKTELQKTASHKRMLVSHAWQGLAREALKQKRKTLSKPTKTRPPGAG